MKPAVGISPGATTLRPHPVLVQSYAENHTGAYRGPGYLLPSPCVVPEAGAPWVPQGGFGDYSLNFTDTFNTKCRAIFKGEIVRASASSVLHQHDILAPASPSRVPVYIKFVSQYGEEVHNLLFEHGFAPDLRWCGRVCGGPMMVVMDEVTGSTTIQDSLANGELVTNADLEDVDAVLSVLGDTFVHGALHPSNVIPKSKQDGSKEPYIIDFDYAGKAGEARYPYDSFIKYPLELCGQLITRQHDEDMRSRLLRGQPSRKRSQPDSNEDEERVVPW